MAGKDQVYEEFEPFCKWQRKEDRDILEIHLQDFKKDQLKVQISNHGILKISGERQLPNTQTRSKFYKEVPVPTNTYNTQSIHAKFVAGCLYITMPKINSDPSSSEPSRTEQAPPKPDPVKERGSDGAPPPPPPPHVDDVNNSAGGKKGKGPGSGESKPAEFEFEGRKRPAKTRLVKVAVSLAATAAAVAVLLACVVYMHRSTVIEFDD